MSPPSPGHQDSSATPRRPGKHLAPKGVNKQLWRAEWCGFCHHVAVKMPRRWNLGCSWVLRRTTVLPGLCSRVLWELGGGPVMQGPWELSGVFLGLPLDTDALSQLWLILCPSPPSCGFPEKSNIEKPLFPRVCARCFILVPLGTSLNRPGIQELTRLTTYGCEKRSTESFRDPSLVNRSPLSCPSCLCSGLSSALDSAFTLSSHPSPPWFTSLLLEKGHWRPLEVRWGGLGKPSWPELGPR